MNKTLRQGPRKFGNNEYVILSEARTKNLHDQTQKRSKDIPHGDSSAYGLRMAYQNLSDVSLIPNPYSLLLITLILIFAIFFSLLAVQQHNTYLTNGLDLGNVDQALWNTAQGRFLHFTLMAPVQSRLALHVEPILLFFVPFYWLNLGGPTLLLVTQAVVVALGAWAVYQLTIDNYQLPIDNSVLPLAFALIYLLLPTLQSAVLFDFHAVTLAPTFLLFAFLALTRRQNTRFWLFAILAMACKEDMPLVVAMLGLYAGLSQRRWKLSMASVGLSGLWFVIAFMVIQPQFAAEGNIQLDRYAWLGDSPTEMVLTLLTQPGLVFDHLCSQADLPGYLSTLFFPVAYLAVLSPLTLLPLLPSLAINLLSTNPFTWRLEDFHYGAPLAPFVIISTIYAVRVISSQKSVASSQKVTKDEGRRTNDGEDSVSGEQLTVNRSQNLTTDTRPQTPDNQQTLNPEPGTLNPTNPTNPTNLILLLILLLTAIYHYHRGFTPLAKTFNWPQKTAHHQQLDDILATIPPHTPLFVQSNLAPHLTHRKIIYSDFAYFTDPNYPATQPVEDIVLDVSSFENLGGIHQFLRTELLESGNYQLIIAQNGILHFKPILSPEFGVPNPPISPSPHLPIPPSFYPFTNPVSPLDHTLQVDFAEVARLHSYTLHFNRQEEVEVTLELEPIQPLVDIQPVLYLLDDYGQPVGATTDLQPTLVWYPVEQWSVGQTVRLRFNTLPWYTRDTQAYRLALGVISGSDAWAVDHRHKPTISQPTDLAVRFPAEGTLLELATIKQSWQIPEGGPQVRQFKQPILPYSLEADFAQQIRLFGHTSPQVSPDDTLTLTLGWQTMSQPDQLIRFVQLIGPAGQVYGQVDSHPDFGTYPASMWQPGEIVVETVTLPLQTERPSGQYTLHIGWYRPDTGERLRLLSGGDHVEIPVIE